MQYIYLFTLQIEFLSVIVHIFVFHVDSSLCKLCDPWINPLVDIARFKQAGAWQPNMVLIINHRRGSHAERLSPIYLVARTRGDLSEPWGSDVDGTSLEPNYYFSEISQSANLILWGTGLEVKKKCRKFQQWSHLHFAAYAHMKTVFSCALWTYFVGKLQRLKPINMTLWQSAGKGLQGFIGCMKFIFWLDFSRDFSLRPVYWGGVPICA